MTSTHKRFDCRYCQDVGTNCGRDHTFETRTEWVRSVASITPASGQWEAINPRTGRAYRHDEIPAQGMVF